MLLHVACHGGVRDCRILLRFHQERRLFSGQRDEMLECGQPAADFISCMRHRPNHVRPSTTDLQRFAHVLPIFATPRPDPEHVFVRSRLCLVTQVAFEVSVLGYSVSGPVTNYV